MLRLLLLSLCCSATLTAQSLQLHSRAAAGWDATGPDPDDPSAVFRTVFAALPDKIEVRPSENYCYWTLATGGRELRGNLRLASGRRERGELNFGYAEILATSGEEPALKRARVLTAADGVTVTCPDAFTAVVTFSGKSVTFSFLRLSQTPPATPPPVPDETFVQRTCDESGLRFLLYYQTRHRSFFWVLDEDGPVPEHWDAPAPDIAAGRRTGFIFWIDAARANRKILAAVRLQSVQRNDYYDGPFDQLADNFAAQTPLRACLESVWPSLKGRIDLYGNYTDTPEPARVAIHPYAQVSSTTEAVTFLTRAKATGDVIQQLGAEGR